MKVTLDPDTEALLRGEVERTGQSFNHVLYQAVKKSLGNSAQHLRVTPLFTAPFPPNLKSSNFNHLSDAWDDEQTSRDLSS
jgi:hypothetical protein